MSAVAVVPQHLARPLSRDEYAKMAALGMFEHERVELVHGVIIRKPVVGPPHSAAVQRMTEVFVRSFAPAASVRVQSPFVAGDRSLPEPDVAVVPRGEYRDEHPTEAMLLVEVADSSLDFDRMTKAKLYAESDVPEYWIVNLVDGIVEVHTDIVRGVYTRVVPFKRGERITPTRFARVTIAVDDVL
jgi:Uma2 family endonuclease